MRITLWCSCLAACLVAGCSTSTPAPSSGSVSAAGPQAPSVSVSTPSRPTHFTGTVVETMDAASYTYVRVKTESGDLWAASGQFPVKVGDRVVVPVETPMENFRSESLKRDFPVIYFASQITREGDGPPVEPATTDRALMASHGAPAGQPGANTGAMMGMMGQSTRAAVVVEKLEPPPGGQRIADVWAQRTSLAGKAVTIRGTVVKFNANILGRNWIHLQDGSGQAQDGTHDLTLTSDAVVKLGDVVTARGIVAVDKDFTAGYVYPVMIENAIVTPR